MQAFHVARRIVGLTILGAAVLSCATGGSGSTGGAKVGPPRGAAIVVGGGALGPEIYQRFIELAGGPDALIIDVPTAGGAATYDQNAGASRAFRAAGAKNVVVLHTTDRKLADSDSFVAPLKRAGGVWFDGGRHYRLVDSYGGTKSEAAFHEVLARGGVVGGSSAGASIQGSYLVRGAPSNNNEIMAYPGYEKGFGFLRGVGIDQHVVARERLPDLADSIMPKHPELLLISEDEGTAWVVQGDVGEIIGRSKAFVYNGKDKTDEGKPFLTLWPGDKYNMAERRVIHRAINETTLTNGFVDSVFRAGVGSAAATVLVAQNGKVLVNRAYNIPPQRRYMPTTTLPSFDVGEISKLLNSFVLIDSASNGAASYAQTVQRRLTAPAGMSRTRVDTTTRAFSSSVDELYRFERILSVVRRADNEQRWAFYGREDGRRNAFVRDPASKAVVIILTNGDNVDARGIADRIMARLTSPS